MTAAPDHDVHDPGTREPNVPEVGAGDALDTPELADVKRRTWLAAERTWLAWWRTGLGAAAVSIGVGRLLPGLAGGARWPLKLLGLGYGVVAIAVLVIGAMRQNHVASALRRGDYDELSSPMVLWLTAAAVALSVATLVVIAVAI
jgi:putative membrane protein